jgi:hypothetical protein
VHVAEAHMRPLPEEIVAAGEGERDPDRRVLMMLGARWKVATGCSGMAAMWQCPEARSATGHD